ncbi:MAG: hypothetical protein H6945_03390 [Zoogloeaceae bacterium]|nr:hypothetical protein [Rhodocyclaceae bacterium]MCP5234767.1 hypothetical protein [Zoogloeaceae bacterium]
MRRQRGFVLPLLLAVLFTGVLLFGIDATDLRQDLDRARVEQTRRTLAEVRQALIAYSMTYDVTHASNPRVGLMPCPDMDNDGVADLSCGAATDFAIGRLPYHTIGVPRLLDGDGECLWYAVAANTKAAGGGGATPMNWDAAGQFKLTNHAGAPQTDPGNPHDMAIAVLIAPGRPLAGQQRTAGSGICNGADPASAAIAAFVEANNLSPTAPPDVFHEGHTLDGNNNDALVLIRRDDVFQPLRRSQHFKSFIDSLLAAEALHLAGLPAVPTPVLGSSAAYEWGTLPDAATLGLTADTAAYVTHNDWREMFRYARCVGATPCLAVNGAACAGLIVFAGDRVPGVVRDGPALDKYFEEPTLTALTTMSTVFFGATEWSAVAPTTDLVACIP